MNQIVSTSAPAQRQGANQLEQLKQFTKVVADTGDYGTLKEYAPQDATTNPSLILKAAEMPAYASLLQRALRDNRDTALDPDKRLETIMDELLVLFGVEILKIVPGRVSTETDANLSFDTPGLIEKAHRFVDLYSAQGISRERVLVKIASTWEGIRAAETLEREGIHCNMTLLFSLPQAVAAAEAKATLISPFVGRILDWYKAETGKDFQACEDPGVKSVVEIYNYYKKFGYPTEVMGASFRNKGEILELAGCDALTISPKLLGELSSETQPIQRKLSPGAASGAAVQKLQLEERKFRWLLNENAMATEKLAEGIRIFNQDALKLKDYVRDRATA